MSTNLLSIPGDGIGPEIVQSSLAVLELLNDQEHLDLKFETADFGLESLQKHGTTARLEDIEQAKLFEAIILGPMSVNEYPHPDQGGLIVPGVLRRDLELFANIRPVYTRPGIPAISDQIDLVIVRENLEDFYVDRSMFRGVGEFMPSPDMALAIGKITAQGSKRIAEVAFEMARTRPRRKVTVIHKAPVFKLYYGLFLNCAREVAASYPDVEFEDLMIDAAAALLIRSPERFDVVLTPNMFGDILSDEAAELCGSIGLGASINFNDRQVLANAAHGSAPDIAGKDVANPSAMMLSVAMMLTELGRRKESKSFTRAGERFRDAVDQCLQDKSSRTRDLGGTLGTKAFSNEVLLRLNNK